LQNKLQILKVEGYLGAIPQFHMHLPLLTLKVQELVLPESLRELRTLLILTWHKATYLQKL
jgi:hypothetical protein